MRARVIVAIAAVMAVALVGVAAAAAPPRLAGTFRAKIKVTQVSHVIGQRVGSTGVVKWKFTPKCASGGCTTILRRHTLSGTVITAKLSVAGGSYKERLVAKQDCFSKTNQVIARNAYTVTTTLTVHPTSVVGGVVKAFTAIDRLSSKVTASARAKGCHPASETWTAKSL